MASNKPCFDYQIELVRQICEFLESMLLDLDPNNPADADLVKEKTADYKSALMLVHTYDHIPELFNREDLEPILEYADDILNEPDSMDDLESRCPTMAN